MAYQVLARKWRPQTFEDLIGQEFAALTLKNSIESGKIAHALIFAGPRGIGKTSTARIVAKAINCEKKDSGDYPCKSDQCRTCYEISEGKSLDIHEIDAASHTGVNDVREIIENVKYMPTSARKKIYIIDEAHMLSQSAFNALLKTLEEPPEHVLFILATTEVHKIPSTILSRCQRYDFKKVSVENIKQTLSRITTEEKVDIDEQTLYLIAKESDGSLRDALSLLDQLIATFDAKIEYDNVIKVLGVLDNNSLKSIVKSIFNKDTKRCIELIHESDKKGISPRRLIGDLTHIFQNLIYLKVCGNDFISDLSDDEKKELSSLIKDQSLETLDLILNILIDGSEKVQKSFYPNIATELLLIKLCTLSGVKSIDEILNKLNNISGNSNSEKNDNQNTIANEKNKIKNLKKNSNQTENITSRIEGINSHDKNEFINLVKEKNKFLSMRLENSKSIEINDSNIKIMFSHQDINFEYFKRKNNLETFKSIAKEILLLEDINIKFEVTENERIIKNNSKVPKKNGKDP
ncbi:MAG: DNA polymerase III subunit gamma/tau, partial [Candidatus Dadabacteria bacterium]|nr:DNA polymerase III subunit gamma/tau [Candidatus Dadabacteria bacterium]NIQ16674.1 DNA polymerase III subunit gamma/tau [Candidatus Dadabacteria bacterium]